MNLFSKKKFLRFPMTALSLLFCTSGFAQTQSKITQDAWASYQKTDAELGRVYQKIIKEYSAQPVFIKKLRVAERLWIQLRDAELAAKFPEEGAMYYGSVLPMCEANYLEGLTKERIRFLRIWLDGIPEGDVCNGSVKTK